MACEGGRLATLSESDDQLSAAPDTDRSMTENAMADTNPYLVSSETSPERLSGDTVIWITGIKLIVWLVAFFHPVLVVLSVYVSWFVAWACLGHKPRPSLDDPTLIGGAMDLAYLVSALALLSAPLLAPLCFISSFLCPLRLSKNPSLQCLFLICIYFALCFASIATVTRDPGGVFYWWFD